MEYINDISILAIEKNMEKISELLAKTYTIICKLLSQSQYLKFGLDKY